MRRRVWGPYFKFVTSSLRLAAILILT